MKNQKLKINAAIGVAIIPLALSVPLTTFAKGEAKTPAASTSKTIASNSKKDATDNTKANIRKEIVKEAADASRATETALIALNKKQPKQALAALKVASGNLDLLLARAPTLGMLPIDFQVQVFEGVSNLKTIKKLEDELEDLIDDKHYQSARPIVDSLVDEIRLTTVYLPLATYPAAIDLAVPLIDEGKLDEAKQVLYDALDTLVSTEEITPLSIIRAEEKLSEAFQVENKDKADLSKQGTKDKISILVNEARQNIKVAQALGYGTKDDYDDLYDDIDTLKKAIGTYGFKGEWSKVKKSLSAFKNKIIHPRS